MKHKPTETLGFIVNGLSIALFFYLSTTLDVPSVPVPLRYLAWLFFGIGLMLIILSTATLIRNREAGLIVSGVYGVVRHPMYLGAILLFFSWIFFLPHWLIVLVSCVNVVIVYWYILEGESHNIAKFGDAYQRYMESVPRINLIAGLLSVLRIL